MYGTLGTAHYTLIEYSTVNTTNIVEYSANCNTPKWKPGHPVSDWPIFVPVIAQYMPNSMKPQGFPSQLIAGGLSLPARSYTQTHFFLNLRFPYVF